MSEKRNPEKFRPLRSVTRLLVGGILLGSELLEDQLRVWEGSGKADSTDPLPPADDPLPETLPDPKVGVPPGGDPGNVRYALIGLIFEGEEKLEDALGAAQQIGDRANRVLDPLLRPIKKIGTSRPIQEGFDQLTDLGQSTLERWINRGREEEINSRQLTQQAASSTIDQSILYMAENEAITELIQMQSVSLAEQILELVRAISVSADYFLEGLLRYLFRQKPRYLLPPPSKDVREQATWMIQDIREEDV
jgi:hypothetical protein